MIPRVDYDYRPQIKAILAVAAECGHEFGHTCQPLCTAWPLDLTSGTSRLTRVRSSSNSSADLRTRRSRRCVPAPWEHRGMLDWARQELAIHAARNSADSRTRARH